MPTFYNYTENGITYSFDDVFVSSDLFTEGGLYSWGGNSYRQLGRTGIDNNEIKSTSNGVGLTWKILAVANDSNTSLAIKSDGTLWAWGLNSSGQVGNNSTSNVNGPTQVGTQNSWKFISNSMYNSSGITLDGTLWMWGSNTNGQIGIGTTGANVTIPTQVGTGNTWTQVSCGSSHTMAIRKDGALLGWGLNSSGQLGDGTTTQRTSPVVIGTDRNWKQIRCGNLCSFGVKTDGTLWSWGSNSNGQLGISNSNVGYTTSSPIQVGVSSDWSQVNCGSSHVMAIKTDGTLWSWGSNSNGQLGNGTIGVSTNTPTQVSSTLLWKNVACGSNFTIAITTKGLLYGCGNNASSIYQLTSYSLVQPTSNSNTLNPINSTKTNWKNISCGNLHTLAITYEI